MAPENKDKGNTKTPRSVSKSSKNGFWDNIESYVSQAGRWAWVWVLVSAFFYTLYLIWAIFWISYATSILGTSWWREWIFYIIWDGLYLVLALIFTFTYIKPHFSIPCKEMKWQVLVDDGFNIGKWRIPKMLFFGILFEIFGRGWGGALILFPALAIIIWGPVKVNWEATKVKPKPTPKSTQTPTKTQSSTQTKPTSKPTTTTKTQSSTQTKPTSKPTTTTKTQSSSQSKSAPQKKATTKTDNSKKTTSKK